MTTPLDDSYNSYPPITNIVAPIPAVLGDSTDESDPGMTFLKLHHPHMRTINDVTESATMRVIKPQVDVPRPFAGQGKPLREAIKDAWATWKDMLYDDAEHGHVESRIDLAMALWRGDANYGIAQDRKAAVEWITRAVEEGRHEVNKKGGCGADNCFVCYAQVIHRRMTIWYADELRQKDVSVAQRIALYTPHILMNILSYCDADTLLNLRQVNNFWHEVVDDPRAWEHINMLEKFPLPIIPQHLLPEDSPLATDDNTKDSSQSLIEAERDSKDDFIIFRQLPPIHRNICRVCNQKITPTTTTEGQPSAGGYQIEAITVPDPFWKFFTCHRKCFYDRAKGTVVPYTLQGMKTAVLQGEMKQQAQQQIVWEKHAFRRIERPELKDPTLSLMTLPQPQKPREYDAYKAWCIAFEKDNADLLDFIKNNIDGEYDPENASFDGYDEEDSDEEDEDEDEDYSVYSPGSSYNQLTFEQEKALAKLQKQNAKQIPKQKEQEKAPDWQDVPNFDSILDDENNCGGDENDNNANINTFGVAIEEDNDEDDEDEEEDRGIEYYRRQHRQQRLARHGIEEDSDEDDEEEEDHGIEYYRKKLRQQRLARYGIEEDSDEDDEEFDDDNTQDKGIEYYRKLHRKARLARHGVEEDSDEDEEEEELSIEQYRELFKQQQAKQKTPSTPTKNQQHRLHGTPKKTPRALQQQQENNNQNENNNNNNNNNNKKTTATKPRINKTAYKAQLEQQQNTHVTEEECARILAERAAKQQRYLTVEQSILANNSSAVEEDNDEDDIDDDDKGHHDIEYYRQKLKNSRKQQEEDKPENNIEQNDNLPEDEDDDGMDLDDFLMGGKFNVISDDDLDEHVNFIQKLDENKELISEYYKKNHLVQWYDQNMEQYYHLGAIYMAYSNVINFNHFNMLTNISDKQSIVNNFLEKNANVSVDNITSNNNNNNTNGVDILKFYYPTAFPIQKIKQQSVDPYENNNDKIHNNSNNNSTLPIITPYNNPIENLTTNFLQDENNKELLKKYNQFPHNKFITDNTPLLQCLQNFTTYRQCIKLFQEYDDIVVEYPTPQQYIFPSGDSRNIITSYAQYNALYLNPQITSQQSFASINFNKMALCLVYEVLQCLLRISSGIKFLKYRQLIFDEILPRFNLKWDKKFKNIVSWPQGSKYIEQHPRKRPSE